MSGQEYITTSDAAAPGSRPPKMSQHVIHSCNGAFRAAAEPPSRPSGHHMGDVGCGWQMRKFGICCKLVKANTHTSVALLAAKDTCQILAFTSLQQIPLHHPEGPKRDFPKASIVKGAVLLGLNFGKT